MELILLIEIHSLTRYFDICGSQVDIMCIDVCCMLTLMFGLSSELTENQRQIKTLLCMSFIRIWHDK